MCSEAISYCVDLEGGVIWEFWRGSVSIEELRSYWTVLLLDSEALALRRCVADLRDCQIEFSGPQWIELLERFIVGSVPLIGWRSAIVVDRSHHFGLARQFLSNASGVIEGAIFDRPDAALAWLLDPSIEPPRISGTTFSHR